MADRLREHRAEIQEATVTRIYAIADPRETEDPTYLDGLRKALDDAVDFAIEVVAGGVTESSPIPPSLMVQAGVAAQAGVSLDTVLRRYLAGYSLLGDFVLAEASRDQLLSGAESKALLRTGAVLLDRLVAVVSRAHADAGEVGHLTTERRQSERIQRLLAGELIETGEFAYDFDSFHIGAIGTGGQAKSAVDALADQLDCRRLIVVRDERTVWAWFGSRRKIDADEVDRLLSGDLPDRVSLAIGEPSPGLSGWRLTHRQALAVVPVLERSPEKSARYADVALVASMLNDELLATSLRQLYLAPLAEERDGGATLLATLRAYISTERNLSSAAALLGVSRRTVANRLRSVEARIGRLLSVAISDIEAALRLHDLEDGTIEPSSSERS